MNDFDNKQICSYKDIDRFGFTCDVCGRKVNGCHYINGMKFCAKCYQETFGKDNQQNEIQQLKHQLAEKDKEIEVISSSKKHFKTCAENMSDILKTINSVLPKPQKNELNYKKVADDVVALIKEKDKEIEQYKSNQKVISLHSKEDFFTRCLDLQKRNIYLELNQKQLAIQELEKVKDNVSFYAEDDNKEISFVVNIIIKKIDNQINELKEKKSYEC